MIPHIFYFLKIILSLFFLFFIFIFLKIFIFLFYILFFFIFKIIYYKFYVILSGSILKQVVRHVPLMSIIILEQLRADKKKCTPTCCPHDHVFLTINFFEKMLDLINIFIHLLKPCFQCQ